MGPRKSHELRFHGQCQDDALWFTLAILVPSQELGRWIHHGQVVHRGSTSDGDGSHRESVTLVSIVSVLTVRDRESVSLRAAEPLLVALV